MDSLLKNEFDKLLAHKLRLKQLTQAKKFCNCGKLEDAREIYENILRQEPQNFDAQDGLNRIKALLLRKIVREIKNKLTKRVYQLLKNLIRDYESGFQEEIQARILRIVEDIREIDEKGLQKASRLITKPNHHVFDGIARVDIRKI